MNANIKFIKFGEEFFLWVKTIQLRGIHLDVQQIERVCSNLRMRHGVAAIPYALEQDKQSLLVISNKNLSGVKLREGEWEVELMDLEDKQKLIVKHNGNQIGQLICRALYCFLEKNTTYWRLDSPRIWYEPRPFEVDNGVGAYYRYEIAYVNIKGKGIGISTKVRVSFFTINTVHHYFSNGKENLFYFLSKRQEDGERQFKATLLYDLGDKKQKCYLVDYLSNVKLTDSGKISISKNENYQNLYDYYCSKYPNLKFKKEEIVAKVAFSSKNLSGSKPVSANRLYLRVMNDSLGKKLKNVDKIKPFKRKLLRNQFWRSLGRYPFNFSSAQIQQNEWEIEGYRKFQFSLPNVLINNEKEVVTPKIRSYKSYKDYFRQKKDMVDANGCYHVPENIPRQIYFAIPDSINVELRNRFEEDLVNKVSKLTGKQISGEQLKPYNSHLSAIYELKDENEKGTGMVVFVMNHEPAIYYDVEYQLKSYAIKRVTEKTLKKKGKEFSKWDAFIDLCAYDIVKQMGCLLYKIEFDTLFDGALIIDVGEKSKNWGLSLFINTVGRKKTPVKIADTRPKAESKETINQRFLHRRISEIGRKAKISAGRFSPLEKLLILRDGRICKDEPKGILLGVEELKKSGVLTSDAEVVIIDFHKTTNSGITLYQVNSKNRIENVFEGAGFKLNEQKVILANTGITLPTLGTAKPIILETKDKDIDIIEVAYYIFILAQYNLGNPQVAQRLPYPVKELDDLLRKKAAQTVNKIA